MDAMLHIEGDPQADALYISWSDQPVAYSKEFSNSVVGDFTESGVLIGIDIQRVSQLGMADAQGNSDTNRAWSNFGAQVTLAASHSTT